MDSETRVPSEEEMVLRIMESMGIDTELCEPNVAVALGEYARRFAGELMRDARDYATHAKRSEIEADDIRLAIKMSDSHVTGVDPRLQIINKVADDINRKSLESMLPKENVLIRYPLDLQDSLLQRTFTCVPGTQAYPISDAPRRGQQQGERATVEGSSHTGAVKFQSLEMKNKTAQRKTVRVQEEDEN